MVIAASFIVTLPPGKAEISARLTGKSAEDVSTAFANQLGAGNVTSATLTMTPPAEGATLLQGSWLLAVADTSATTGIESAASQSGIRRAIADLAMVYLGDVSPLTFSSPTGMPLEPAAQPDGNEVNAAQGTDTQESTASSTDANAETQTETSRRLTAGSVNVGFSVSVPGVAAQGWAQDCAMKRAKVPALEDGTDPAVINNIVGTAAAPVTRDSCATTAAGMNAELWTFTEVDGDADTCAISSWAKLSDATYDAGSVTQVSDSSVCGPCPAVAPAAGSWPGADAAAANTAFGTHQPFGLQCWPKKATAASPSVLELLDCGSSVVQTHSTGWPGTCNNLDHISAAATESDCRAQCQADPFCSVWMWATAVGQTDPQCFSGVGNQCWTSANPSVSSVATAERLQHGLVQVLVDNLNGGVLEGLQQQFNEAVQLNGEPLTAEAQKENCRIICHSNVGCTFWQSYYHDGTAATGQGLGCWTEAPGIDAAGRGGDGGYVQYPTTTSAFAGGDAAVPYITGGQYIQHYCQTPTLPQRPQPTTTTTTTTVVPAAVIPPTPAPSGGFMNPYGYMLIVAGLLAALAAVVLILLGNTKKAPTKKASRGLPKMKVKPEPPAPPAPPQPVVPLMAAQPVMVTPTIPQPLTMTTIQQPTTIAAPAVAQAVPLQMATYAGAPQVRPY
jgi:hypothetical protein